jgi:fatty acid desaturase 2 (delta-6 desaturase)
MFIRINNTEYDISNFKHPGGKIINFLSYKISLSNKDKSEKNKTVDAYLTYKEFHNNSKKADKYLNSLPKKDITKFLNKDNEFETEKQKKQIQNFIEFRKMLYNSGFFKPSYFHIFYRIFELFGLFILGNYLLYFNNIFAYIISSISLGLFSGRCGWFMHEGGHSSLTTNIKIDKHIQKFFYGFGSFMSANQWNSMHNRHHAAAQKVNHDVDLATTPFIAFYNNAIEDSNTKIWSKLWLKYQAYLFPTIISGFIVPNFWIYILHMHRMVKDKDYLNIFYVIIGHIIRISLISYITNWNIFNSYLYNLLTFMIGGIYIFVNFSLSHTSLPIVPENEHKTWLEYAFEHTYDINPQNPFINWWMSYLNCQVEHHLFPTMPQFKQPLISKMLVKWCMENDIEYKIIDYTTALKLTFNNLNNIGLYYYNKK